MIAIDKLSNIQSPASNVIKIPGKNEQDDRAMKPPKLQGQAKSSNGKVAVELNWSKPHNNGNFIYYIFSLNKQILSPVPITKLLSMISLLITLM